MEQTLLFEDKNWQPTTKTTYSRLANYYLGSLNGTGLGDSTVRDFKEYVKTRKYGNSTARLSLTAIQMHIRDLGMEDHPLLGYKIPNLLPPPQPTLTFDQKEALLRECDTSKPLGARDAAIIELLWVCGPRKSEIPEILLDRLDLEDRWVSFETKAIRGKGKQWRTARLNPGTVKALKHWLKLKVASPDCKTIFCGQSGNALTPGGIGCIFKRLSKKAGFRVSPHDFRRGGASYMCECGAPDRLVMNQFGWRDYATFHRYTRKVQLYALDDLLWGVEL